MNTRRSPQDAAVQPTLPSSHARLAGHSAQRVFILAVCVVGSYGPVMAAESPLVVRPRQISLICRPGVSIHKTLEFGNAGQQNASLAMPRTIDVTRDRDGRWIPVSSPVQDIVISEQTRSRSCRDWISVSRGEAGVVTVQAAGTASLDLTINVPATAAEGSYWAAVQVTLPHGTGPQAAAAGDVVVPVLVDVDTARITAKPKAPPITHFGVGPMKISLRSRPERLVKRAIQLQNLAPDRSCLIAVKAMDLERTATGVWLPVDLGSAKTASERVRKTSCKAWLSFGGNEGEVIQIGPSETFSVPVDVSIPAATRGVFCGAVVISVRPGAKAPAIANRYDFVVPVLVTVLEGLGIERTPYSAEPQVIVMDSDPIKVQQDGASRDPLHTYAGAGSLELTQDVSTLLVASAVATGAAAGEWTCTTPTVAPAGTNVHVPISVKGTSVQIENMVGSPADWHVAEVVLKIVPQM
jgi:hypothetical protein